MRKCGSRVLLGGACETSELHNETSELEVGWLPVFFVLISHSSSTLEKYDRGDQTTLDVYVGSEIEDSEGENERYERDEIWLDAIGARFW